MYAQLTRDRFRAARIGDAEEVVPKTIILLVVPVTENNGKFFVIGMHFILWVKDERCPQSVHIFTLPPLLGF